MAVFYLDCELKHHGSALYGGFCKSNSGLDPPELLFPSNSREDFILIASGVKLIRKYVFIETFFYYRKNIKAINQSNLIFFNFNISIQISLIHIFIYMIS